MSLAARSRSQQQQQPPEVAQQISTTSMLGRIHRQDRRRVVIKEVAAEAVDIITCTLGMPTLRPLAALP
jgi:hypothetical protein